MSFDHGPDGHTCSWRDSGDRCEWWRVPDLWEASRDLPASEVCLGHLSEVHDHDLWLAHWTDPSHPLVAPPPSRVVLAVHRLGRQPRAVARGEAVNPIGA